METAKSGHDLHLTKNQSLVLGALTREDGPASAYVLLDRLHQDGFRAPLQVYRALDKLIELGHVHRLESLNSFVACTHPQDHPCGHKQGLIAFAICESCGHVDEFCDHVIERRVTGRASIQGFKLAKTTIELRGTCASCLLKTAA